MNRRTCRNKGQNNNIGRETEGKIVMWKQKVEVRNSPQAPKKSGLQSPLKNKIILSCVDISSSYREVNTPSRL